MKLKNLRQNIQKNKDLTIKEISEEIKISERSIYRIEDEEVFENSIFIRYLNYLRENKVNINHLLKEIFEKEKEKEK